MTGKKIVIDLSDRKQDLNALLTAQFQALSGIELPPLDQIHTWALIDKYGYLDVNFPISDIAVEKSENGLADLQAQS